MFITKFILELIIGIIVAWTIIQYEQKLNRRLYPGIWCFFTGIILGIIEVSIEQHQGLVPFLINSDRVLKSLS